MRVLLTIDMSLEEAKDLKHFCDEYDLPSLEEAAALGLRKYLTQAVASKRKIPNSESAKMGSARPRK